MAITYGIDFPFRRSLTGSYLNMTDTSETEIRANLIHLLLTRKGTRYFLPEFGTRLYEFIFEPNDQVTFDLIEEEIRDAVRTYIPNLTITSMKITPADQDEENPQSQSEETDERLFRVSSHSTKPYTAKVKLEYEISDGTFSSSDFIIINI